MQSKGDHRQDLLSNAEAGDAVAQFELGRHLLRTTRDPAGAVSWIERASAQGHAAATQLCAAFSGGGFHRKVDWAEAFRLARVAADRGDVLARDELSLLGDNFDVRSWLEPPATIEHRVRPRIQSFPDFLPRAWCEWIMKRAHPLLAPAVVYTPQGMKQHDERSNSSAWLSMVTSDLILQLTDARIANACLLPAPQQEPPNVLHYRPGQEFKRHHDYLDPRVPSSAKDLAQRGQRLVTILVYLNDGYEGGETDFPALNWRFRGKAGDALMFWNIRPDGVPDWNTLHAGLTPSSGEKWLLSKWIRDRPFPTR